MPLNSTVNFLWINAKGIPFRGYLFYEPVEELILDPGNIHKVKDYFHSIEALNKKGLYALGFITYELGYLLEPRLAPLFKVPSLPLAHFIFFKGKEKIEINPFKVKPLFKLSSLRLNLTKDDYEEAILKIKRYIASGDTYQVNFTAKFHFSLEGEPIDIFKWLLFSQRCEYACYFRTQNYAILSFSPELFLKREKNYLKSSPMKGTLKRAYTLREDLFHRVFLKADPKSQAENIMIVDLIRNDLGKICEKGSVWVKEIFKVKTYPTLHQMISTIGGKMEKTSLYEIFKALFPCGSVTGAPKIRTMEIICELEKEPRGVYTGAMGYITPKGEFIFNVAIRSALLFPSEGKECYKGELGVGAGIVWDSSLLKEYKETKLKAQFFLNPHPYFCLFETFQWLGHKENPLLFLHYKRLVNSAKYFQFRLPRELKNYEWFLNYLKEKLSAFSAINPLRVKLLLSPEGGINLEVTQAPSFSWESPLLVGLIKRKSPPVVYHFHKTTLREEYEKVREYLPKLGLKEVIFYNEKGEVLEGTISNLFWKRGDIFYTPPLSLGLLPGVLRESLLRKKKAVERLFTLRDLEEEKGSLYIGNSLRGLGRVEKYIIIED